jgi:hypothetical protein
VAQLIARPVNAARPAASGCSSENVVTGHAASAHRNTRLRHITTTGR